MNGKYSEMARWERIRLRRYASARSANRRAANSSRRYAWAARNPVMFSWKSALTSEMRSRETE